jgi:hypothetical protein
MLLGRARLLLNGEIKQYLMSLLGTSTLDWPRVTPFLLNRIRVENGHFPYTRLLTESFLNLFVPVIVLLERLLRWLLSEEAGKFYQ